MNDHLRTALAAWNTGIALAREAHQLEATCQHCGLLVDRNPNRTPPVCAACKEEDR